MSNNGPYYAEGRYAVRVDEQAMGKAGTGTPQFILRFTVLGRVVNPDSVEDVQQYQRTAYIAITDKTVERFTEDIKALGYTFESFKFLDPNVLGYFDFAGMEIDMYCKHDTYQGNTKEKWGFAKRGGGKPLEVKALDSASTRQLDNLFGKYLKAKGGAQKVALPVSAPAQGFTDTDDDVPF